MNKMTKGTLTVKKKADPLTKTSEELRIEEERLRDIHLLVEHLLKKEEVTLKLLLDCVYDIGSVNLINTKVRSRSLNPVMKYIARLSKPAFRIVALRWVQKNCPQLLANWLYRKVSFK
ncbi:MAG: hypothetical protein ACOC04_06245 [Halothece sp.]